MNVCNIIAVTDICIGCGMCVPLCPNKLLSVGFNIFGEYIVSARNDNCRENCGLCLKICPFADNEYDEDNIGKCLFSDIEGISHKIETGYYLGTSFVGYSNIHDHRIKGASGGLATWILEQLFYRNMVDMVCCVSPNSSSERLFEYVVCKSPEEMRRCGSSAYHPVELSAIIDYILENDGRYALVGLPCMCKAIRMAMDKLPTLRSRIKYVLGLACGQTKSRFFSECMAAMDGGDPHQLMSIQYRVKSEQRSAANFGMAYECSANEKEGKRGTVFWMDGMGKMWNDRHFTVNACNFCDDVFSETADACFMDAWLPRYSSDFRGHTIVLFRHPTLRQLVEQGITDTEIRGEWLPVEQVVLSQPSAITSKRSDITERIRLARKRGRTLPRKREYLFTAVNGLGRQLRIRVQYDISLHSRKLWVKFNKNWTAYQRATRKYTFSLKCISYLERAESAFTKVRRFIGRSLNGKQR